MSDRERIDRLRNTRPEDLSPGEVEELRKRAGRSKEVRKAVKEEIRLDQALYTTMGSPPHSTADVVANAKRGASPRRRSILGGFLASVFGWLLAILLTTSLAAGTVAMLSQLRPTVVPHKTNTALDLIIDSHDDDASPSDVLPRLAPKNLASKDGELKKRPDDRKNANDGKGNDDRKAPTPTPAKSGAAAKTAAPGKK